ncbi:MAG: hypothetical protein ICV73_26950 [Acetobacteraceae bacterium]|nr:hypothetical protein [Acetobacteraceae bacterium]
MRSFGPCAAAVVGACLAAAAPAARAEELRPDPPRRFADCAAISDARRLDAPLHRSGITARRCFVAPGTWIAVLSDDAKSWPVVRDGSRPPVSMEHPERRLPFENASPLRVSDDRDALVVLRGAGRAPRAAFYSAAADRADAPGRIPAFVVVRIRPRPCLLGVARGAERALELAEAEERRLAAGGPNACPPPADPE